VLGDDACPICNPPPPPTPPATPTGFSYEGIASNAISVYWSTVSGATSYQVKKDNENWGPSNSSTSHTFTGLTPSTTYTLYVRAGNNAGWGSPASQTLTTAPTTYTVKYDANNGSGAPNDQAKTHGVTLTLSSTKPTRTNYAFLGWATSSTATTAQYQAGGSYTANASVILYAVWGYTVKYDANGGSGAPNEQTKTHGVTLTLSSTKPTRSGCTFLGWATSSTATTAQYQAGGSYTANASVILYAVWGYTVTYHTNGGDGYFPMQTKLHGVPLTIHSSTPCILMVIPFRGGRRLLGIWYHCTQILITYS